MKRILFTDWAVFLIVFGYWILIGLAIIAFIVKSYPYSDLTFSDWIEITIVILFGIFLMTPFAYWWCRVTQRTFKNGGIVYANITDYFGIKGPYIGIYYAFLHNGKEINKTADLVNNATSRELVKLQKLKVIYDEKKNLSFVYNAYCQNKNKIKN